MSIPNAICNLSIGQMESLVRLISGPLASSWSAYYLEREFGKEAGSNLQIALSALESDGWNRRQIIDFLLAFIDRIEQDESSTDWVFTGRSFAGIPSRDTAVVFRSLVESAQYELVLSSYAVFNGKDLLRPLHDKMVSDPRFRARMILDISRDRDDMRSNEAIISSYQNAFMKYNWPQAPFPEVYYDPRGLSLDPSSKAVVHAKCVVIDKKIAFVTSANVTEAAQEKNIEVGVLVSDEQKVEQLQAFFDMLISESLVRLEFR